MSNQGKPKNSSTGQTSSRREDSSSSRSSQDSSNPFKRGTSSRSSGPSRSSSGSGRSGGFGGGSGGFGGSRGGSSSRSSRPIKKFNPSDFIRKVEETVAALVYTPKHLFSDFLIEDQLKKNIADRGYTTPTPIQDQAIPYLLEGKDLIGTANTGTGKTAAFLIPLVNNLLTKKTKRVLILTPTRELAAQIQEELTTFTPKTGFSSVLCIGGVTINPQIEKLKRDPAFVIGTPGRIKDLEENGYLRLSQFNAIVLDEVDTMFDMGFINDIKHLISRLPRERHSLFFSATISPGIKAVMDKFLQNPVSVSVKTRQSAENVNQDVIHVNPVRKVDVLHDLLIKPEFSKVIIFVRTKRAADKLSKSLRDRGFRVATIHGDKSQPQRKKALESFKDDEVKILLATDVVARGIDIDDVSHVINFDLPGTHEDYIHRIGRTGRANKIGQALTFIES